MTLDVVRTVAIGAQVLVDGRLARALRRRDVHLVVEYEDGSVEVIDPYSEQTRREVRRAS
jgi:hypothetical protein